MSKQTRSFVDEIFGQIAAANGVYRAALTEGDKRGASARALRRLIQRIEAFEREMTLAKALPIHRIAELREAIAEAKASLSNEGAAR